MSPTPALPKFPQSYWIDSTDNNTDFPKLQEDVKTDVTVIGGGISGITTAYLLAQAGMSVVLLEAGNLLQGTTGHTTAKITAQHDLIYDQLIRQEGVEKAALYYQANAEALQFVRQTVRQNNIECGLLDQDAYVFTNSVDYIQKLQAEASAYETLGIPSSFMDRIQLQVPSVAALKMDNQAQFHPLRYLNALINAFQEKGGQIYEHTTAIDIEEGVEPNVVTNNGFKVACKHVAICSHFPFFDGMGFYFARMHAERSYVLGITTADEYPGGMYISAEEPKRSIRSAKSEDGRNLLLISGQTHKTGQGVCTINHYETLESYAKQHFQVEDITYRWSAQDLVTGDKIPYIGNLTSSSPNIYVATGYKKWGMTSGTAAGMMISDLIQEKQNRYVELFSPSRSLSLNTLKTLVADNFDVAKHLISGKLEMVHRKPEELAPDEGGVVSVHGRRAGGYRDSEGKLYLVDTTCTHMGCEVEWNDGERTWDCPCHGSRFSFEGEVMEGPAERPLKTLSTS